MPFIIGVDIGTSSTKAIAFELNGNILAAHNIVYPLLTPQPGYAEQDPEVLFNAVLSSVSKVVEKMKEPGKPARHLAGISFSSAMHGLIAMNKDGQPLTNCMIWADTRSEPFATALKGTAKGHDIYRHTGTPIHPMSPLCKLGWMREHMPDVFQATYIFIGIKEYVFYKLFGQYVVDESIASATGLFNIHTQTWYAPALEVAGIRAEQLAKPVSIQHIMSGLGVTYAANLQIPADTPFILGGSDGCLANLGVGAIGPGIASVTVGTSGAIRIVSPVSVTDKKERLFSYILTPDQFVIGGAVNNGGIVRQWFSGQFMPPALSLSDIDAEAASVQAGADGLIFLPYLTGERAPHWDAKAKGLYFGIQLHHTRAHFARAMMEGVLFALYAVGKALEETTEPITTIYASGGFAHSALWLQMLADIFHKPVLVKDSVESSAWGAAIAGMNALGLTGSPQLAKESVPSGETYLPDRDTHQSYMKNFAVFERLYEKVKDEF